MSSGGWDIHAHHIPSSVLREAECERFGLEVTADGLLTPGARVPLGRIDSINALATWVDDHKLSGALVSPPPPLFLTDLDSVARERWVSLLNDGIAEACSGTSNARPLAYLPLEDPPLAMKTIDGLDEGWLGVAVGTDVTISSDSLEPVWRNIAERKLAVWLHPSLSADPRLSSYYLDNLLGNPTETAIAIAHFLFGGVLERNPELVVVAAHGGGVVSAVASRWNRGWSTKRPGTEHLSQAPRELLKRIYVDTVVHEPYLLRKALETFGEDRLLLGTDWPFPMGLDSPDDPFRHLPERLHQRVRSQNAAVAFGLDTTPSA